MQTKISIFFSSVAVYSSAHSRTDGAPFLSTLKGVVEGNEDNLAVSDSTLTVWADYIGQELDLVQTKVIDTILPILQCQRYQHNLPYSLVAYRISRGVSLVVGVRAR